MSVYDQDWNLVIIHGKSAKSKALKDNTAQKFEKSKEQKLLEADENLSHEKVSASIGKNIQLARVAKGYTTQKALAQALNMPVDIIAAYESGKAIPDNAIKQKLRRTLQVKI